MTQSNKRQGEQGGSKKNVVPKAAPVKKTFGEEGTNKTQPLPDPSARPSDVGGGGKFIEPTPFTR